MMKKRFLFAFILFLISVLNTYAGIELRSRQMKTSDGLPSNSVRYMYQDSKGFLWFGTLNGLSRYDGNSFLTFQPGNDGKPSLADNRIFNITVYDQSQPPFRADPNTSVIILAYKVHPIIR